MFQRKIIIAIHGIGNKPPQPLLQQWWRRAICEGLERIGRPRKRFKLELAYWAHFLYSEPEDVTIRDQEHPLYIRNPYVRSSGSRNSAASNWLRRHVLDLLEVIMDKVFFTQNRVFNFDRISDYVIRRKFSDLELYYHEENVALEETGLYARQMIRDELAKILRKHRRKQILLISHSLGTVVAYDVLTQLVPEVGVHTLITLGSPLGLPMVMKKIFAEQHKDFKDERQLTTPENIEHAWLNFSDLNDRIAMNYNLADDFSPNSHGIKPVDTVVENDYEFKGKRNHHKSYGYLRAPEVTAVISDFVTSGRAPVDYLRQLLGFERAAGDRS